MSETWSVGRKRLLKRLGDEVEVLAAMKRNRNLHFTGLAQLVTPLQWGQRERKHFKSVDESKDTLLDNTSAHCWYQRISQIRQALHQHGPPDVGGVVTEPALLWVEPISPSSSDQVNFTWA